MNEKPIPMADVRARGWVVIDDDVFDLARWSRRHPGGDFLTALAGRDATTTLANAHLERGWARRRLRALRVGPFDPSTRDPVDHELLVLGAELRARGFFDYGRGRIAADVARWLGLFVATLAVFRSAPVFAFVLLLVATIDIVWWIHDAGHDAIFREERTARWVIELAGIVALGMPQQGYHYGVHRLHHGFTNVVGLDRALETGPLSWDAASAAGKPRIFRRGRIAQWFVGIVPLAGPVLLASALASTMNRKRWPLAWACALRWSVAIALAIRFDAGALLVVPFVAGSVLAFMAGLNHFHLPMSEVAPASYVRAVFERTQNIGDAGPLWRWLSGGLDHHIEHHLFPTMPSRRYPEVAPFVRALAARHDLPYHSTNKWGAVRALAASLARPPVAARRTP